MTHTAQKFDTTFTKAAYAKDVKDMNVVDPIDLSSLNPNKIARNINSDIELVVLLLNANADALMKEEPALIPVQNIFFKICEKDITFRKKAIRNGAVFKNQLYVA